MLKVIQTIFNYQDRNTENSKGTAYNQILQCPLSYLASLVQSEIGGGELLDNAFAEGLLNTTYTFQLRLAI